MLQTGSEGPRVFPATIRLVRACLQHQPTMPVVNGEVCYEGIHGGSHDDVQRFLIWSAYLSGEAGHTYGANGIWQLNRREQPYGTSASGSNYGTVSWDEAMKLPGSGQVGLAKRLLETLTWNQFEPHQEWVTDPADLEPQPGAIGFGIPKANRVTTCRSGTGTSAAASSLPANARCGARCGD